MDWLSANHHSDIQQIQFRNKRHGWNLFSTCVTFKNNTEYIQDRYHDPYMVCYLEHNISMRPSCYECQFKGLERFSDLTLGDFWGIGRMEAHLDDNKGTSVVIVNSHMGKALFEQSQTMFQSSLCQIEDVVQSNACLFVSSKCPLNREAFFTMLASYSFSQTYQKYRKTPVIKRIKRTIRKLGPKIHQKLRRKKVRQSENR